MAVPKNRQRQGIQLARPSTFTPLTREVAPMSNRVSDQLPFADRRQAGVALAQQLSNYKGRNDVVVLALPRGGVPVAYEVARALDAPLDIFVVRKLGMPGHREFAIGAIASGGVRVLNDDVIAWYQIPTSAIERVVR